MYILTLLYYFKKFYKEIQNLKNKNKNIFKNIFYKNISFISLSFYADKYVKKCMLNVYFYIANNAYIIYI